MQRGEERAGEEAGKSGGQDCRQNVQLLGNFESSAPRVCSRRLSRGEQRREVEGQEFNGKIAHGLARQGEGASE